MHSFHSGTNWKTSFFPISRGIYTTSLPLFVLWFVLYVSCIAVSFMFVLIISPACIQF